MKTLFYDREAARGYALKYALTPNTRYYYYGGIGGDCTNFCSQCVFAGAPVQNYTPTFGWYYTNGNNKAPAWTGVNEFYRFLTTNQGVGPYGKEVARAEIRVGDIVQLSFDGVKFTHGTVVVDIKGGEIYICCHSAERANFALSGFRNVKKVRYLHIEGYRKG
jgi:hypothetical protein